MGDSVRGDWQSRFPTPQLSIVDAQRWRQLDVIWEGVLESRVKTSVRARMTTTSAGLREVGEDCDPKKRGKPVGSSSSTTYLITFPPYTISVS